MSRPAIALALVVSLLAQGSDALATDGIVDGSRIEHGVGAPGAGSADTSVVVRAQSPEVLDGALAELTADGVEPRHVWDDAVLGFSVAADAETIAQLRSTPGLVVETDGVMRLSGSQNDPPWGVDRLDQRDLPASGTYTTAGSGAGVTAYVIDSGVKSSHAEFAGRISSGYSNVSDGLGSNDCNGHGTHVAGTLGGTMFGVAKGVRIVPVRVFTCVGQTSDSSLIDGINWVVGDHVSGQPAVANMSLGGVGSSTVDSAVQAMIADGITVVVAAGNDGRNACLYSPARVSAAITVGATDPDDSIAPYSNYGTCNDIFAPGTEVRSAGITVDDPCRVASGTSMAAPHVAGAAALVLEASPSASPGAVWATISAQATTGRLTELFGGDPDRLLYVPSGAVPPAARVGFTGVSPARLLETRPGEPTSDGGLSGIGALGADSTTPIRVTCRGLVAWNAEAVSLNVTVTNPAAAGFVTVFPCGSARGTSSVNFVPGQTVANGVVSKVGVGGTVCVYSLVPTDVIVDVTGWFAQGGGFNGVTPARLFESRSGEYTTDGQQNAQGLRQAGQLTSVNVGGRSSVPGTAGAVSLNVTVTNPVAAGFVTVFPCGDPLPGTSSVNFVPGQTVANGVVSKVGVGGTVCLVTSVPTDVIVDVTGWFAQGSGFNGVTPARLFESRSGEYTTDGQQNAQGLRQAGQVTAVDVGGRSPVPGTAGAVSLNVTVTNPMTAGFVKVFPCGDPLPGTSSVNFVPGQTVANNAVAKVGAGGRVCAYTSAPTDLIIDVTGWFPA